MISPYYIHSDSKPAVNFRRSIVASYRSRTKMTDYDIRVLFTGIERKLKEYGAEEFYEKYYFDTEEQKLLFLLKFS